MALTAPFEGTQAVDSTEWSCTTDTSGPDAETSDGVFQAFLDVSDMVAGDVLVIRAYEKVQTGSTQRCVFESVLRDTQTCPVWVSPTLLLLYGWDFTLKATSGTITVDWSLRKVS